MAIYALDDWEPRIHPDAYVHPDATVIGRVTIGAGSTVWPQAVLRGDYGIIEIGERTSVQDGSIIHCTEQHATLIGSDCVLGHAVHVEGATVADHCLIGSGSVVLNGVVVEEGAVVGAGAVVSFGTRIPARAMALGVPARIREGHEVAPGTWKGNVERYVENGRRYRTGLRRLDG